MGIGVQTNLPGSALTQMALPSLELLPHAAGQEGWLRAEVGATLPATPHSSHSRNQRGTQLTDQQSSHSPDGIFQFGQ